MANADDKVMAAVEAALKKDPKASVDELYAMAKGISSGVGKLSKRQFHARYPLQVKRRSPKAKRAKGAKKAAKAAKPSKAGRKKAATRRARPKAAARAARKAAGTTANAAAERESVRRIFMRFASDLAAAEARKDVVKVVAGVDRYVNDVIKATGK